MSANSTCAISGLSSSSELGGVRSSRMAKRPAVCASCGRGVNFQSANELRENTGAIVGHLCKSAGAAAPLPLPGHQILRVDLRENCYHCLPAGYRTSTNSPRRGPAPELNVTNAMIKNFPVKVDVSVTKDLPK